MFSTVFALKSGLVFFNLLLGVQYLMVRKYGSTLERIRTVENKFIHRGAASLLVIFSSVVVALVLYLEFLLRKDRYFIAPSSLLLFVHLFFALTFFTSILLMRYKIHGTKYLRIHLLLGKKIVPTSLSGMIVTGLVLVVKM